MTAITRDTIDALLDAGALQISMLTDDWFTIRRDAKMTSGEGEPLYIGYLIDGHDYLFGSITDYEFDVNGGVLPPSYYRVRQDA